MLTETIIVLIGCGLVGVFFRSRDIRVHGKTPAKATRDAIIWQVVVTLGLALCGYGAPQVIGSFGLILGNLIFAKDIQAAHKAAVDTAAATS